MATEISEKMARAERKACQVRTPGQTPKQLTSFYDQWKDYDEDMISIAFGGPEMVATSAACFLPDKDVTILDVAAGTGKVAEELKKLGYHYIDALEPSEGMLQVAKDKNLYRQYFTEYFTDNIKCIKTSAYDAIVCSGAMIEGHLKLNCLPEMVRCVKPGGLVVLNIREDSFTVVSEFKDKLEPYIKHMEDDGLWKCVERKKFANYVGDNPGVVFNFKITKSA